MADCALLAFLNIFKKINKTRKILAYRKDPDIIKRLADCKLSNANKNINEWLNEAYLEYIDSLESLDEALLKRYLKVLKNADVKDNQSFEKVDSFLLSLYLESERSHAIDAAIKKDQLSQKDILNLHSKLLKGTSNETSVSGYRNHNRSYVGYYDHETSQQVINFLPLDYHKIDSTMTEFTEYFNANETDSSRLFINPFIVHGMIGTIQVFDDGNTRLARLLQNVKLHKQTNGMLEKSFTSPILFITKPYFPQRVQYRSLIEEMAKNPDNDNINNWIRFNLYAAQGAIDVGSENVKKMQYLK